MLQDMLHWGKPRTVLQCIQEAPAPPGEPSRDRNKQREQLVQIENCRMAEQSREGKVKNETGEGPHDEAPAPFPSLLIIELHGFFS